MPEQPGDRRLSVNLFVIFVHLRCYKINHLMLLLILKLSFSCSYFLYIYDDNNKPRFNQRFIINCIYIINQNLISILYNI